MTRRICPKCQRGFLRASDVDAGDYECMACGIIAGFDQDGSPDYRTQLRLEEYRKRSEREMVKTADATKAIPKYLPSTADIRVPDTSTAGLPVMMMKEIPLEEKMDEFVRVAAKIKIMPSVIMPGKGLPPVPEKPTAPRSIQRYYRENIEAIRRDYAAMGGKKTRERWGISNNGWASVKKMLLAGGDSHGASAPQNDKKGVRGGKKRGCPDAARAADAPDTLRRAQGERSCYPGWEAVSGESDEVKVAWLNNYAGSVR